MARGWDSAYAGAPPAWDIGRPQPVVVRIAENGGFAGRVLDSGCGTGENALYLAGLGLQVTGVDWSELAIGTARAKADERGSSARFEAADATGLGALDTEFDSALDCGLFHTFDDSARAAYVRSLASVLVPGATIHVLCFSEHEPGDWGPRRVTQQELRDAFATGWNVQAIEAVRFATLRDDDGAHAWHATIVRH